MKVGYELIWMEVLSSASYRDNYIVTILRYTYYVVDITIHLPTCHYYNELLITSYIFSFGDSIYMSNVHDVVDMTSLY